MDPKYINNQLRKNINKNIVNRSQSAVEYQLPVIISMVTEPSLASLCMQPMFYVFFFPFPYFHGKFSKLVSILWYFLLQVLKSIHFVCATFLSRFSLPQTTALEGWLFWRPLTRSSSPEIGEGGFQNLRGWNIAQQINVPAKKMQNKTHAK